MSQLTVIGGTYREVCVSPSWDQLYGSGLRAAVACAELAPDAVELVTWCDDSEKAELRFRVASYGVVLNEHSRTQPVVFSYEHPLAVPVFSTGSGVLEQVASTRHDVELALLFGILEVEPEVYAKRMVFDPQAGERAARIPANVSELCIVANLIEAQALLGGAEAAQVFGAVGAARELREQSNATAVVVKDGARGVAVATREILDQVPCYKTAEVFSIGSGDVFSAIFSWAWMLGGSPPLEAADIASRATAQYCGTATLPIPSNCCDWIHMSPLSVRNRLADRAGVIYLAGPFFTVAERWFVAETCRCLRQAGFEVFSPFHDVGLGGAAEDIAARDLEGLEKCDAVFAIADNLDAGTMFEIGCAASRRIPVVVYAERVCELDLTMLVGAGGKVCRDFTTAIYELQWLVGSRE